MKRVTASVLVALMGLCSIGVGYVLTELYAEEVVERTISALAVNEIETDLSSLAIDRWQIKNESSHALARRLSLHSTSIPGEAPKKLSLDTAQDVNFAHAWLAAKRGEKSFRDQSFVYLLSSGVNGVNVRRIAIAQLPRPGLSLYGVLATLLALVIWFVSVRVSPSRRTVLVGSTTFAATWVTTIVWCFERAWQAIEPLVPNALPSSQIGESMIVVAAVLVPVVIAAVLGTKSNGLGSPHREAYAYLVPAVISMLVLVFIPFILGIGLAFTRYVSGGYEWVGLDNFVNILSNEGLGLTHPLSFYFTLAVTVLWTFLNVIFHAGLGLGLALLLNRPTLKFKAVYRVLLIIPWAVPSYITALVWHGMFNPTDGFINACLVASGLDGVAWFDHFWTAFSANVITNTWLGFPFMMVVSLGALQSIPTDLYEAAEVDGATRWDCFKSITIPLLRPALLPAVILGAVWTFNMFNVIYLVSGGGPSNQTDILITEAYRWAFEKDRYGYAAAYSMLIFMILLLYSFITQRIGRSGDEEAV